MTPESVQTPEPSPAGMGEFARITGVFFEPTKTFQDVAERPRWVVPMLLIIVVSIVYMALYTQHVGWERMMRHQLENNTRAAQMSNEQREQMIATQARFAPIIGYVGAVVGVPIYMLVSSAVLLAIVAGMMSAPVKFKQIFAVMSYAGLTGLVSAALAIVVMFLKNPDDFNLQNPLVFNPGAFMDPLTSSKFLYSLASSLDLFVFWNIFLIATGIKAAAGKRMSFGKALFAVMLPWGLFVLGKSAVAGMFG
jgi:Yip1 domain